MTEHEPQRWRMYAGLRIGPDGQAYFCYLGDDPRHPRMMGVVEPIAVEATEDPEGTYWGWLARSHWTGAWDRFPTMIHERKSLLDLCFPGRPEEIEERGGGRIVRLRIERAAPDSRQTLASAR